jgi:delta 1-pyrroline-5-carboxylate dehydrogenase
MQRPEKHFPALIRQPIFKDRHRRRRTTIIARRTSREPWIFCPPRNFRCRSTVHAHCARRNFRTGTHCTHLRKCGRACGKANSTIYGLAAGIWTRDIAKAHNLARKLQAGTVWINAYGIVSPESPFGGYRQSGFGRELGQYGIDLYSQVKSVWVSLD